VLLREARAADLPAITLFDEFGGSRADEVAAGLCQVVEIDGMLAAYASYAPRGLLGQPLLTYLCVAPAWRRRGVATALVRHIQQLAQGRKLISSTEDWCTGTQHIFERLGWSRAGTLAGVNKDGSIEIFYTVDLGKPSD